MADLDRLYQAVLNGDAKAAVAATRQAIDEGMGPVILIQLPWSRPFPRLVAPPPDACPAFCRPGGGRIHRSGEPPLTRRPS
jgi:hypothetical protein